MSTVPIPQGATVDQDPVPIPQGATVDAAPPGQKPLDPNRPGIGSTDDQGNIYFQGQKVQPQEEMVVPTPGAGLPTVGAMVDKGLGAAAPIVRTLGPPIARGVATAAALAKTPLGKIAINGAVKAAEYAIGIKLADLWRGL